MGPGFDTPYAVVDHAKMTRNISRLATRLSGLGVALRPHVKTAKSIEVAHLIHGGRPGPITVSTLAEAEGFAAAGFTLTARQRRCGSASGTPKTDKPSNESN